MKILSDFEFENKRVLMRCDFNVPLDEQGNILDDFRIEQTIPTLEYLVKRKSKLILMSHLDDPGGKIVENLRLISVQEKLMEYLDLSVTKAKDCIGREIEDRTWQMAPGEILLLENLRFHKDEKINDQQFAQSLTKLGDIYINDAFATCHRNHASIVSVPKYLPSAAGFLLEKEVKMLTKIRENPARPLVAIIGGTFKEKRELMLLEKISEIADFVLIGGLIQKAIEEKNFSFKNAQKIILPIKGDVSPFDLGPQTLKIFKEKISQAKTIFWSGPVGKIEEKQFAKGTEEIARTITQTSAFKVAGGGATIDFIRDLNLASQFDHLSTGGGAMLAFLAGEELPGIKALG